MDITKIRTAFSSGRWAREIGLAVSAVPYPFRNDTTEITEWDAWVDGWLLLEAPRANGAPDFWLD